MDRVPPILPDFFRACYFGLLHHSRHFRRPDRPAPPRPKGRPYFTRKNGGLLPPGAMDHHLPLLSLGP